MMNSRIAMTVVLLCMTALLCCTALAQAGDACVACHKDWSKVLPKEHVAVEAGGTGQCLTCHTTGTSGAAEKNPFSTRVHTTHMAKKVECTVCHSFEAGKQFGLKGQTVSWGGPKAEDLKLMQDKMTNWLTSSHTDAMHHKANVDCAGCHGKKAPLSDDTVENDRCLQCHGPVEKLAAKTANKEFPKRNPHASHYGSDIACTTCHHAHEASVVMCADCHKLWKLDVPGAAK